MFTFQPQQISIYLKWLQETPKNTVVRVNTLRTSCETVRMHIEKTVLEATYLPALPVVDKHMDLPEVLFIGCIDGKLISHEPRSDCKEIIVDTSCAAAVLRGSHIYGVGCLAMQSNTKIDEIVNVFADLEGKCRRGMNCVYESKNKMYIGFGLVKMQRFELFNNCVKGVAIKMIETISGVPSIGSDYLLNNNAILQNLPSIICARVLDPRPSDHILDMCAAPGNKTSHIAQLMQNTGILIALDKSKRRVETLKRKVIEFDCVRCFAFDATKSISDDLNEDILSGPPFMKETFDKVLLDGPCSGMGNRPIFSTSLTYSQITSFAKLQKKLMATAAQLLKTGGILVYSTCTIFEAENELNVVWFLDKYAEQFELVGAKPIFGGPGLPTKGLNDEQCRMVQRFGPNLNGNAEDDFFNDSIGFFICRFRKIKPIS